MATHDAGVGRPTTALIGSIITRHLDALRRHHSAALEDKEEAAEAVHKLRVTTRRLQAILDLLQFGASKERILQLKSQLRTFRNDLAGLRNYDVFLSLVDKTFATADSSEQDRLALLRNLIQERRDTAARKAKGTLKGFTLDVAAFRIPSLEAQSDAEQNESSGEALVQQINRRAARRLTRRLKDFLGLAHRLMEASNVSDAHQLRIAAKRLRYLLETLTEMGQREPKGVLEWLRGLQSKVGDWHDLAAFEQEVITIVRGKGFLETRLVEGAEVLFAMSQVVAGKDAKATRIIPVRPPVYFERSVVRIIESLKPRGRT